VEQTLSNPKLAAQYTPGDRIEYRQGSQSNGIANNSNVQVLAVDPKSNQLTVQTSTGDEITYSPHLTRAMTAQSTVYRLEQREIAVGERIQFGEGNLAQGIRKGDFGTVTAMSTSNDLEVRLDRGSTIRVNEEQAQHIEHGYAVQKPESRCSRANSRFAGGGHNSFGSFLAFSQRERGQLRCIYKILNDLRLIIKLLLTESISAH
jgi:hypothetical protein